MQTNKNTNLWFDEFKKSEEYRVFLKAPVAYFCAEYALDSALTTYAGGLGVLAGDYVREAALRGFPLLAVGLCYKNAQSILSAEKINPKKILRRVVDKDGKELQISLPLENRMIYISAWEWREGEASVYLLDTDLSENDPIDRDITKNLYDDNRDLRLKQEIILGIGGFRMLAALGHHASVYHLNESHSAFIALELVRHEMEHQRIANFLEALKLARKHVIFTNHTILPEGQELFAEEKVSLFLAQYAEEMGLVGRDISKLGGRKDLPGLLSMTTLAFNLTSHANAVSRLHAARAKTLWPKENLETITNGIFIPRWDKVGKNSDPISDHLKNKKRLLALVEEKSGEKWGENDLILVWARRLVEYKQPTLILDRATELLQLVKNSPVPIHLVFSGPTREDENGNPYIAKIKKVIKEKLPGIAVFIPNYSTAVAETLTAGADVWLNTPLVGFEACGTSGMKAALNGALALTTGDGWVAEVAPEDIGWVMKDPRSADEILSILRDKILPSWDRPAWTDKMKRARNLMLNNFSTTRVLKEYIEKLYLPALKQKHTHRP